MSGQVKFLLIFAVIVLGTVLYFKRQPAMDLAASLASERPLASDDAGQSREGDQLEAKVWERIAPCWNGMANSSALPTKLKLSFDAKGQLSAPPEIERDPNAPVTDQNLQSEALALQALSACAPYRMARGQQGIVLVFPTPAQMPMEATGSQQTAAVTQR